MPLSCMTPSKGFRSLTRTKKNQKFAAAEISQLAISSVTVRRSYSAVNATRTRQSTWDISATHAESLHIAKSTLGRELISAFVQNAIPEGI